MEISNKFKPFRLSPLTREVENYLKETTEGDVISYEDLTELIDLDCKPGGKGYSYVISAIKRLETIGCNFVNIVNKGYRRINPSETVIDNARKMKNKQKQIKRIIVRNEALDGDRLEENEKYEWKARIVTGKMAHRILSTRAKTKFIKNMKKHPDPLKINYEDLEEIYLRRKSVSSK